MFQLKTKELVAKKRLQSFAKNLAETHPAYKELLEKVEKEHGMPFCKLEESKHAPWNVRHTNRWKLKCNIIFNQLKIKFQNKNECFSIKNNILFL